MNAVKQIKKSELNNYLCCLGNDVLIVRVLGRTIRTFKDYSIIIANEMKFPTSCENSIDSYLDWMTDLTWLDSDSILIIIYDYDTFMSNEPKKKIKVIDSFKNTILPFWETEVEKVVVNGRKKSLNILLVV